MLVERNITAFRHGWIALVTGFAEPVFYLFSLGVGIGALVQTVTTDGGARRCRYAAFVAPALLAASAMNGAVMDCTFNVFFKLKYAPALRRRARHARWARATSRSARSPGR